VITHRTVGIDKALIDKATHKCTELELENSTVLCLSDRATMGWHPSLINVIQLGLGGSETTKVVKKAGIRKLKSHGRDEISFVSS